MGDCTLVNHLVCLGMGFSATALAELAGCEGWKISGSSRTAGGAADICARGWHGFAFDAQQDGTVLRRELAGALSDATHLVLSIPPGDGGDVIAGNFADDISRLPKLQWVGYLSTIGVYGDHHGDWVDEATSPAPISKRSKLRLEAENAWQRLAEEASWRLQIFRLAGIYGPGRSAIDQILAGKARRIIKKDQVFNRIHVADIATILRAGMAGAGQHTIYNVADDEPGPPQDVIAFAAQLLGMEPPPEIAFEDADLSPMGRSFYNERKRVRNDRIKTDLGIRLSYPNYREGLEAIMAART